MTRSTIGRRELLKGAGAMALAAPLVGMAGRAWAQERHMRYFFWGGPARADNRQKAVDLFTAAKGNVGADVEWAGWDDYWPRLNTQIAGGNAPDLIQMDYGLIQEFANRDTLLALDDYVPSLLNVASFGEARLNSGRINGKMYGITAGDNSQAMFYDVAVWKDIGVAPSNLMSWDEFRAVCQQFKDKKGRADYFATPNRGGVAAELEMWLRQNGKALYVEGKPGFTAQDVEPWFDFWNGMTQDGLAASADVQGMQSASAEGALLTQGLAAISFGWSNDLVAYKALNPAELGILTIPGSNATPGQYIKPSQFLSVSSSAANPELAVELVNFLLMDAGAVAIQKLDVGVPPDPTMREGLIPHLNETEQAIVAYLGEAEKASGALPPPPPAGAGEVALMLTNVNAEVMFGLSPEEGAQKVYDQANEILDRA